MSWFQLIVLLFVSLLLVAEVSYRLGRRMPSAFADEARRSNFSTMTAATAGLFALLLGFTLAMADARFAARRDIKMDEAVAIDEAYRRTEILPDPQREASKTLLRDYVEARRDYYQSTTDEPTQRAHRLHGELWYHAMTATRAHPDWDSLVAYVDSLGDVIQLEAKRGLALDIRVPQTLRGLLVVVALFAVAVTAFGSAVSSRRSYLSSVFVPLLVGLSLMVVSDLDRSRAGLIATGDLPMERLQRKLAASWIDTASAAAMPPWPPTF